MASEPLPPGLYEQLIDHRLEERIRAAERAGLRVVDGGVEPAEAPWVLAQHVGKVLSQALRTLPAHPTDSRQLTACNRLISVLAELDPGGGWDQSALGETLKQLLEVSRAAPFLRPHRASARPETPLALGALLTGTRRDPSLVSQIRKELASADRVDILCSFIKWSGIRILEDELRAFVGRAGRLRVITTSYLGATDQKAVDFLRELRGAEVRLTYDTKRTRLHAKAYLFHRQSDFGTAYVGSSNLSHPALTEGLEWNLKLSQFESPHLWEKVTGTFESYWNDAEFTTYTEENREQLRQALAREKGVDGGEAGSSFFADMTPHQFQEEILDRLAAEREYNGRYRNLVVAATGTGKTVIAAFDFTRFRRSILQTEAHRDPRLLFIAHREEILKQSRDCFRNVLRDRNFGDLLVADHRPEQTDHLFASIQSFNSKELWNTFPSEHFDFVIVDEFHHAEAPSYERLLEHVQPKILLGLTATPERADGKNVQDRWFGGHITAEIRLHDAINRRFLSPFQYFGITDGMDLSGLTWQRGHYQTSELERLFTETNARADLVIRSVTERLLDVRQARGLGFCVSQAHAHYMSAYFNCAGIPAEALDANSPSEFRNTVQRRLVTREINFIFVVDLYNEGVDIPEIDTVLLLRPTESLTVFLQQLGRGLRLHPEKEYLTVLDFIGQAHRSFNWEMRFRALMDRPRKRIDQEIDDGCLHVPLGCVIRLERAAQQHVLENIRGSLNQAQRGLVRRIKSFEEDTGKPPTLANFLDHYEMEPDDIFRRASWSRLCHASGLHPDFSDLDEGRLTKGLRRLAHITSPDQIQRLLHLLDSDRTVRWTENALGIVERRILLMLHFSLWGKEWPAASLRESVEQLQTNPVLYADLLELLRWRLAQAWEIPPVLQLPYPCPLTLHSAYTRDEILAGMGHWTLEKQPEMREGVLYLRALQTDLFLITLNKTEKDYSPTTLYEDYAVSAHLFHWQSQSTTSSKSETGKRYIDHRKRGGTILLFVRENSEENGLAAPFFFLGPAEYESHTGSRPMSILWRLKHHIPARLLPAAVRLAAG